MSGSISSAFGSMNLWPLEGSYIGYQSHWKLEKSEYKENTGNTQWGLIDTSMDRKAEGKPCYIYNAEPRFIIRFKAIVISIYSPLIFLRIFGENLAKVFLCPFFFFGKIFVDRATKKDATWKQCFKDNMKNIAICELSSLGKLSRSIHFVGFLLGAIYMIADPYNGRKILSRYLVAWVGMEDAQTITPCMLPVAYAKSEGNNQWKVCDAQGQEKQGWSLEHMEEAPSCILFCLDNHQNLLSQS